MQATWGAEMSDRRERVAEHVPDDVVVDAVTFRHLVESSVSPFVVVDARGTVRWAGPAVETLLGQPPEHYVGRHFLEVVAPGAHEAAIAAFTAFNSEAPAQPWIGPPMLLDMVHSDGSHVSCEVSASRGSELGFDGAVLVVRRWRGTVLLYEAVDAIAAGAPLPDVLGRLVDIVEHDLPGTRVVVGTGWDGERFRTVAHHEVDGPERRLVDLDGVAGAPWHRALEADAAVGPADLVDEPAELVDAARAAGYATCWAFPVHVRPHREPNAVIVVWRQLAGPALAHLVDSPERVGRLVALAVESDATRQAWRRAARVDALTGLANRPALLEDLQALLLRAAPDAAVAVLFCDLDGFKPVNDHHGHDVGDVVLGAVAERLRAAVRPADLVARWGGDEFVVVCGGADRRALEATASRLVGRLAEPVEVEGTVLNVGMSIGIAVAEEPRPPFDLLRQADQALREAKRLGKGRWHQFD